MKQAILTCLWVGSGCTAHEEPMPAGHPIAPRSASRARPHDDHPSVQDTVLITIETTRADRVGPLYGHPRPTFPHLSQRAQSGRTYTRAFANSSWTLPSMTSIYTGRSPFEHGVHRVDQRLGPEMVTLGAQVGRSNIQTAFFGVNPVFVVDRGLAAGFDHWQAEVGWSAGRLNQSVIEWLNQEHDPRRPLFLHVHYFDPHCPYIPPDAARFKPGNLPRSGRTVPEERYPELGGCYGLEQGDGSPELDVDVYLDRYDRELLAVDAQLERLLQKLQERGLLGPEDRLVITSDHGEAFWEHDDYGHSHTLWGETTWVPLIIWDGDGTGRVDKPVGLADLFSGLSAPTGPIRPERSDAPKLQHTSATGVAWTAALVDGTKWMTDGNTLWKTNIRTDPLDQKSTQEARGTLPIDLPSFVRAPVEAPALHPSDAERELLRALGYSF